MADREDTDYFDSEEDIEDEEEEEESEEEEPAPPPKKKKQENKPLDWKEVNRWQRDNHTDKDIDVFICKHLDDLNRSARVTIDNTLGSLAKLAEKLWIVEAIYEHEVQGQCMPLFKTYVIGKQILDQDSTVF